MKIQYTFTSELEDTQEIIYQKYNRVYNRNNLSELHTELKADLLNKESLKHIEKLLTNYKDALVSVIQEVEENRNFLETLLNSLNGAAGKEAVKKKEEVATATEQIEYPIESLTNIVDSLTNKVSDNEQTQPV
jgi:hypothetical protein